jgi:hypothetical protein
VNPLWVEIPLLLQALTLSVDEVYFHRQRFLPRWERRGHPIDTLSAILPVVWMQWHGWTTNAVAVVMVLGIFSTVLITKDEMEHKKYCTAGESWLHALLFILHPVVLFLFFLIWAQREHVDLGIFQIRGNLDFILPTFIALASAFMLYQIVAWKIWRSREPG